MDLVTFGQSQASCLHLFPVFIMLRLTNHPLCFVFSAQTWERYQSEHLTICKKANRKAYFPKCQNIPLTVTAVQYAAFLCVCVCLRGLRPCKTVWMLQSLNVRTNLFRLPDVTLCEFEFKSGFGWNYFEYEDVSPPLTISPLIPPRFLLLLPFRPYWWRQLRDRHKNGSERGMTCSNGFPTGIEPGMLHACSVRNTIKVWYKIRAHLNTASNIWGFTPIWGNRRFSPGRGDAAFRCWTERGISKLMDMYNNNDLLYSFDDMQRIYKIPSKHLQIPTN